MILIAVVFLVLGVGLAYAISLVNSKYPLIKKSPYQSVLCPALDEPSFMKIGKIGTEKTDDSKEYEEKHKARLIIINHEPSNLYGISMPSSLSLDDASKLQRILEATPEDTPIHLVLRSQGGSLQAVEIILNALKNRKEVHVFVPEYAQSAATMIALAGTLHMGKNAFLTAVDPQLGMFSAYTIVEFVDKLSEKETGLLVTIAKLVKPAALGAITRAESLLANIFPQIPEVLKGKLGHDKPLFVQDIQSFKKVEIGIPEDLQKLLKNLNKTVRSYGF